MRSNARRETDGDGKVWMEITMTVKPPPKSIKCKNYNAMNVSALRLVSDFVIVCIDETGMFCERVFQFVKFVAPPPINRIDISPDYELQLSPLDIDILRTLAH